LHFIHKFDCIEDFKDLGSQGRTCNIAYHALVFMVRGVRRKWKQQVAASIFAEVTRGKEYCTAFS
jgi:hypothetical protein